MLHKTLGAMAGGGMYDRVEGGFFRYSTTRQWEGPHFEKMLEDNAELLAAFAEAHRSFPGAGYGRVGRARVRWVGATLLGTDGADFAGPWWPVSPRISTPTSPGCTRARAAARAAPL